MSYIFFGVGIILFPAIFFVLKLFFKDKMKWVLRGFALALALFVVIRVLATEKSMFEKVQNLSINNPYRNGFECFITVVAIWLMTATSVINTLVMFFDFPILKNLSKSFGLFSTILATILLTQINYSFVSIEQKSVIPDIALRDNFNGSMGLTFCGSFIALEVALSLCISVYNFLQDGFIDAVKNKFVGYTFMKKNEAIELACALPIVLFFSLPSYLPGTLFKSWGAGLCDKFHLVQRLYLYLSFIVLFGLYFLFQHKDKEYTRMGLLYISLVTLIAFCHYYSFLDFPHPWSWPLHLCHTAMFITPICLIFKLDKVFYFTLFINVLGAFMAMCAPSYTDSAFYHNVVRFWINHIQAFTMPVLIILLGLYERPKLKHFIYSNIGFLAYFILVLFLNAWFTNYDKDVDFFFINSDFIADKLGKWAEDIFTNSVLRIKVNDEITLLFRPLYQVIYYLVYVAFSGAMWFLYVFLFQFQDYYIALSEKSRKIKLDEIALCAKYQKKEVSECMNQESVNKLVVKNCSKRYGNNKNYSTKDISFEVNCGEILGFLGPNGAGKSTTIKCIVGIQPPTDGSIEINGYDIEKQPVQAKAQFGFVPDHYALYEKLTGREYINYIADIYNVSQKDRDERLAKLMKDLSMEANIDNQIRTYSHGMKQKIAIMSALIHNPKLWILDEPLTGLDPNSIYEVKQCMINHAKEGNIVFFSSHIIDLVEKLCDRIIIINHGRVVAEAKMSELQAKNIPLEKFYLDLINNSENDVTGMEYIPPKDDSDNSKPNSWFFRKKEKKVKVKEKEVVNNA